MLITVDRVDARYRLPRSLAGEQPRLQRVVDTALTRLLETAIEREGVEPGAYICIDSVRALATVRLREPDSALAAGVGEAIAAAIRQMIDEGSASVVRYGSRVHALIDLAASAMAGDFSRSWAWTQLGLWRADFPMRADRAAELIVRALAKEPTHVVAAIAHLAEAHPESLVALIERAPARAWADLARAALHVAGADDTSPTTVAVITRADERSGDEMRHRRTMLLAGRVLTSSIVARVSRSRAGSMPAGTSDALAALALLETEPFAAREVDIRRAIASIAALIAAPIVTPRPSPADATRLPADTDARVMDTTRPQVPFRGSRDREHGTGPADGTPLDLGNGSASTKPAGRPIDRSTSAPAVMSIPDVRRHARTRHGGVLYLLNLLPRIGLIDQIGRDPQWSERGVRWVLHQLAMALAPLGPDDPAALVFAGLVPDAPPPSSLQDPPTDAEQALLHQLRTTIVGTLSGLLGVATGPSATDREALLEATCHRRADIVADPGWIDVRFSLDDVSLDIRRVGLDVNPGWIPWLGIVVRFVYA